MSSASNSPGESIGASRWRRGLLERLLPRATPSILQMEAAECGVACLAMVLAHFGRHESLETLRETCSSSRNGMNAAELIADGERFGLAGEAHRLDVEELCSLPLPQILHWDFNHFVVLVGISGSGFVINDPARGRRRIGLAEMNRSFTGIALLFRPAEGFMPARNTRGLLPALWQTLGQSRGAAVDIVITSVLIAVTGIFLASATRLFIDDYLAQGRGEWLLPLLAGMLLLAGVRGVLTWLGAQIALFLQTKVNALMSSQLVWTLLRLPFPFLARRSTAELSTRMQIAGQVAGVASGPFLSLFGSAILVLAYGIAMLAYSPLLTLLVLAIAAFNMLVLRLVDRTVIDANADAQMAASKAHSTNIRGIAQIEEARASGMTPLLFRRLLDAFVDETNAHQAASRVAYRLGTVPFFCANLLTLVVLCAGAYEVMRSEMTIGTLLAFQMLAELFAAPLAGLVGLGSAVLAASGGITRTNDLLGARPRDPAPGEGQPFSGERLSGRITMDGMIHAHRGQAPSFAPLSVGIEPGEMVLVVGDSGSGKTALAMIAAGVLTPTEGTIRFDDKRVSDIPAETFRHSIGLVQQNPFFAAAPLRDALTLWDFGPTTDALQRALRDAAVDDVVNLRPGGLAGRIGEGGVGFSGGELQRLAIARALVHAPSILVVDDATTALDEVTERRVLTNLRRLGITVVMLTSRRSLAPQFDRTIDLHPSVVRDAA